MKWKAILAATIIGMAIVSGSGLAAANHDGGEQCDQLDNALDAIDEHADENAEDNNQVERAQDECNGDHHQDEANDGGGNADQADARSDR